MSLREMTNTQAWVFKGDLGIDGRLIFKWLLMKHSVKDVDWIHLAQDRVQWPVPVNDFRAGNFLTIYCSRRFCCFYLLTPC
jgi:hypothetical protein